MPDGVFIKQDGGKTTTPVIRTRSFGDNSIRVGLVENDHDKAAAAAVRAIVWLAEPGAKFRAHFDANDWNSSHVILWVGEEPAGTLRIRWFADAPRFERMAIRPEFRSLTVFRRLVTFALDLCAAKGYREVIGMSRDEKGMKFWSRLGGVWDGRKFEWNGEHVYPMRMELKRGAHPALARGLAAVGEPDFERALGLPEAELVYA